METAPSIENVYQVLNCLYHSPDSGGKEKASTWLGELQKSVYAWTISDELLTRKADLESCYFAAQTMRVKIHYAFHELPGDSYDSLKNSLLNHLSFITEHTNPAIVTQLCLALADLALQMTSWTDPIGDLVTRLLPPPTPGSPPGPAYPPLSLLEVLTVLPEESSSHTLRLGANRRNQVTDYLVRSANTTIQILSKCAAYDSSVPYMIQMRAVKCLAAWFTLRDLPTEEVVKSPILGTIFHLLGNPQTSSALHEACADSLCAGLYLIDDLSSHEALAATLYLNIIGFQQAYHQAVAEENYERSLNFCRLFTELAESLLQSMVYNSHENLSSSRIVDLVVACVSHPDYDVAQITFNFWYRLSEELYQKNDDTVLEVFKCHVEQLIMILHKQIQIESDHTGILEPKDEFAEFRERVSELIKDVVFIIGSQKTLQQMSEILFTPGVRWEETEAALFIIQAISRNILPTQEEVVGAVVSAIVSLPADTTHAAVMYSGVQVVGELCEWIQHHPTTLEPVLNFLLAGLRVPSLASVSAASLQSICTYCSQQMGPRFSGLLHILESLHTFSLSNDAAEGLVKGAASVCEHLPPAEITEAVKRICLLQATPLDQLLKSDVEVKRGGAMDPVLWLDRLAAVFRSISINVDNGNIHPVQPIIMELWPVLSLVCTKHSSDVRVVERYCRCVRFAIRCVGRHAQPVLQPLVQQMVSTYAEHSHSCFLYLGSVLVDEFAKDSECLVGLIQMLEAMLPPAFKQLQGDNGMLHHPDTIDDLFRLCTRLIQRGPLHLLKCEALMSIMQCAVSAVMLEHRDAHVSVLKFLSDLVRQGSSNKDDAVYLEKSGLVVGVLTAVGQPLMDNLIKSVTDGLPAHLLPDVSEFILELSLLDTQLLSTWLGKTMEGLARVDLGGRVKATDDQLQCLYNTIVNASAVKTVSHALRDITRLYR